MKPPLVFVSPTMPRFQGNGLAMRAAHNLRALAEKFSIHLLVISIHSTSHDQPTEEVLRYCASWKQINVASPAKPHWSFWNWIRWGKGYLPITWSRWNTETEKEVLAYLREVQCTRMWLFRFYLFPWIKGWLDQGQKAWLDLDELESCSRKRLSKLFFSVGENKEGQHFRKEAQSYRTFEKRFLPRFERIITASEMEAAHVQKEIGPLPTEVWPNIISPPTTTNPLPEKREDEWRLLFIGSLGHFPNREAIRFAALEILPKLQTRAGRPVILSVAGAGADSHRPAFADLQHVEWLGTVPDLVPVYARTDLVIVPLRSGGGTRIKILEAFAHRKPVVSTRIGAEGLNVAHGKELLLADDPDELANACVELLEDPEKRNRLGTAGYAYVTTYHGEKNLRDRVAALSL